MSWLIIVFVILIVFHTLEGFSAEKVNKTFQQHPVLSEISINIECLRDKELTAALTDCPEDITFQRLYLRCCRKKPVPEEDNNSHDSFLLSKGESYGRSF
jgi:hypothetical protein